MSDDGQCHRYQHACLASSNNIAIISHACLVSNSDTMIIANVLLATVILSSADSAHDMSMSE